MSLDNLDFAYMHPGKIIFVPEGVYEINLPGEVSVNFGFFAMSPRRLRLRRAGYRLDKTHFVYWSEAYDAETQTKIYGPCQWRYRDKRYRNKRRGEMMAHTEEPCHE